MTNPSKIVIYNDTPGAITNSDAVGAVLKVMQEETGDVYGGPYKVFDRDVVTAVQNKNSATFRVARCVR